MSKHPLFAFVGSALIAGTSLAQETAPATPAAPPVAADNQTLVTLTNGDIIKGVLVSDGDPVIIDHSILGRVSFPRSAVASVSTMSMDDAGKATAAAAEAAAKFPPPPPAPDPDSFFKGWKGLIEGGVNGASGNTEELSARFGIGATRETSKMKTALSLSYNYGTNDGEKSKDNGRFDARNDWLPQGDSKWRPFVQGAVEYDTFQDWDWRASGYAGLGYELIKTDKILLLPRFGIGASKEFGGEDNKIHPEALLGADFAWTIDDRSKFFISADTYWLLDELPAYRAFIKAGYEIVMDEKTGMLLKLGIEDRYDSTPGEGKNRNDLNYFALIAIPF
jgi:putative salt-induced outer membrane protein YdiY